jgi:beta-1,4-N-acetylglucosaminyltransferase
MTVVLLPVIVNCSLVICFVAALIGFRIWNTRMVFGGIILDRPPFGRSKYRILAVLGSGGHTSEMLRLLKSFTSETRPLELVLAIAESDTTSLKRVAVALGAESQYQVMRVKRIREVGDSIFRSILRSPGAFFSAFTVLLRAKPDVIISNGPGTALPIVLGSVLLQSLFVSSRTVLMFCESFCRVRSVSLTGRILYPFVDSFILQWHPSEELGRRYPRARYLGSLM